MNKTEFIKEIVKWVKHYAPKYGISVYSPTIAQAILESSYGKSELGVNAFNFFGLKFTTRAASQYYIKSATEQRPDGTYYTVDNTKWCKFNSIQEGVEGYFKFISSGRYIKLKGVTDPRTYLTLIKEAGYATSLKYVDNLMDVVNRLNLTQYDPKNILYRVQVGAYSIKLNADLMCNKITKAGYKPIVKKVDKLYKVQIGAFSIRDNALNLANELKKKGFDAYITN